MGSSKALSTVNGPVLVICAWRLRDYQLTPKDGVPRPGDLYIPRDPSPIDVQAFWGSDACAHGQSGRNQSHGFVDKSVKNG